MTDNQFYEATKKQINASSSLKELRGIILAVNDPRFEWSETKARALTRLSSFRVEKILGINLNVPNVKDATLKAIESTSCYINYLDSKNPFEPVRKDFDCYQDAFKFMKDNLDRMNSDFINFN